ncbi:MAG: ribosome-binding factor A [Gammaproteobacteria bacterium]|nr:ribosome-binding factor A [Gammaproteobacteria bacterium]
MQLDFFRSHLAKVINARKVPCLVFYYDDHADRATRMMQLIEKTRRDDKVFYTEEIATIHDSDSV